MQNIHIKRYERPNEGHPGDCLGTVEPEDESWVLFIHREWHPSLYLQVDSSKFCTCDEDDPESVYVPLDVVEQTESGAEVPNEVLYWLGLQVRGSIRTPETKEHWDKQPVPEKVVAAREALKAALEQVAQDYAQAVGTKKTT